LAAHQMPLDAESVADRCLRLKKTLCWLSALERLHLSLGSSNVEIRILGTVFVAQLSRPMSIAKTGSGKCCTMRPQSVGDDDVGLDTLGRQ
jgi:hypothetical protein